MENPKSPRLKAPLNLSTEDAIAVLEYGIEKGLISSTYLEELSQEVKRSYDLSVPAKKLKGSLVGVNVNDNPSPNTVTSSQLYEGREEALQQQQQSREAAERDLKRKQMEDTLVLQKKKEEEQKQREEMRKRHLKFLERTQDQSSDKAKQQKAEVEEAIKKQKKEQDELFQKKLKEENERKAAIRQVRLGRLLVNEDLEESHKYNTNTASKTAKPVATTEEEKAPAVIVPLPELPNAPETDAAQEALPRTQVSKLSRKHSRDGGDVVQLVESLPRIALETIQEDFLREAKRTRSSVNRTIVDNNRELGLQNLVSKLDEECLPLPEKFFSANGERGTWMKNLEEIYKGVIADALIFNATSIKTSGGGSHQHPQFEPDVAIMFQDVEKVHLPWDLTTKLYRYAAKELDDSIKEILSFATNGYLTGFFSIKPLKQAEIDKLALGNRPELNLHRALNEETFENKLKDDQWLHSLKIATVGAKRVKKNNENEEPSTVSTSNNNQNNISPPPSPRKPPVVAPTTPNGKKDQYDRMQEDYFNPQSSQTNNNKGGNNQTESSAHSWANIGVEAVEYRAKERTYIDIILDAFFDIHVETRVMEEDKGRSPRSTFEAQSHFMAFMMQAYPTEFSSAYFPTIEPTAATYFAAIYYRHTLITNAVRLLVSTYETWGSDSGSKSFVNNMSSWIGLINDKYSLMKISERILGSYAVLRETSLPVSHMWGAMLPKKADRFSASDYSGWKSVIQIALNRSLTWLQNCIIDDIPTKPDPVAMAALEAEEMLRRLTEARRRSARLTSTQADQQQQQIIEPRDIDDKERYVLANSSYRVWIPRCVHALHSEAMWRVYCHTLEGIETNGNESEKQDISVDMVEMAYHARISLSIGASSTRVNLKLSSAHNKKNDKMISLKKHSIWCGAPLNIWLKGVHFSGATDDPILIFADHPFLDQLPESGIEPSSQKLGSTSDKSSSSDSDPNHIPRLTYRNYLLSWRFSLCTIESWKHTVKQFKKMAPYMLRTVLFDFCNLVHLDSEISEAFVKAARHIVERRRKRRFSTTSSSKKRTLMNATTTSKEAVVIQNDSPSITGVIPYEAKGFYGIDAPDYLYFDKPVEESEEEENKQTYFVLSILGDTKLANQPLNLLPFVYKGKEAHIYLEVKTKHMFDPEMAWLRKLSDAPMIDEMTKRLNAIYLLGSFNTGLHVFEYILSLHAAHHKMPELKGKFSAPKRLIRTVFTMVDMGFRLPYPRIQSILNAVKAQGSGNAFSRRVIRFLATTMNSKLRLGLPLKNKYIEFESKMDSQIRGADEESTATHPVLTFLTALNIVMHPEAAKSGGFPQPYITITDDILDYVIVWSDDNTPERRRNL